MEMTVRLDWSGEREVPARPSNVVLVQGAGEELFLSFGHIAPPIAVAQMDEEQTAEYLGEHPVAVQHVARFALSTGVARRLMNGLQEALLNAPATAADAEASS